MTAYVTRPGHIPTPREARAAKLADWNTDAWPHRGDLVAGSAFGGGAAGAAVAAASGTAFVGSSGSSLLAVAFFCLPVATATLAGVGASVLPRRRIRSALTLVATGNFLPLPSSTELTALAEAEDVLRTVDSDIVREARDALAAMTWHIASAAWDLRTLDTMGIAHLPPADLDARAQVRLVREADLERLNAEALTLAASVKEAASAYALAPSAEHRAIAEIAARSRDEDSISLSAPLRDLLGAYTTALESVGRT